MRRIITEPPHCPFSADKGGVSGAQADGYSQVTLPLGKDRIFNTGTKKLTQNYPDHKPRNALYICK
jgi:hypothetical protein